jgi:hypothetical protein
MENNTAFRSAIKPIKEKPVSGSPKPLVGKMNEATYINAG